MESWVDFLNIAFAILSGNIDPMAALQLCNGTCSETHLGLERAWQWVMKVALLVYGVWVVHTVFQRLFLKPTWPWAEKFLVFVALAVALAIGMVHLAASLDAWHTTHVSVDRPN